MQIFITAMITGMIFYAITGLKSSYRQSRLREWLKDKKNRKTATIILIVLVLLIYIGSFALWG